MYPLWWPNHIVPTQVSRVIQNLRVVCETKQECISVSYYEDLRQEKMKYTHAQSLLFDGDYHLWGTFYNSHIS